MRVVFVHGACVKDGSWWWHRTAELLAERDVASEAPALPSCGETGEPTSAQGPGLSEDVAAVRGVLMASDEPTVVVAHSYGGIVTAEAAVGVDGVRHVLLVSSYLPEVGQSLSSFGGEEPARSLISIPRAARSPSARTPWPKRSCRTAVRRSSDRPQTRLPVRAWRSSSSRCGQPSGSTWLRRTSSAPRTGAPPPNGNASSLVGQASVVELDAGHHPFLSQPAAVRDLVLSL